MSILAWVVFGLIAGVIANLIDPQPAMGGIFGAILLGILGAVIGGFLGSALFGIGVTGFNFSSMAIAVLGSLLLLFVGRMLRRGT